MKEIVQRIRILLWVLAGSGVATTVALRLLRPLLFRHHDLPRRQLKLHVVKAVLDLFQDLVYDFHEVRTRKPEVLQLGLPAVGLDATKLLVGVPSLPRLTLHLPPVLGSGMRVLESDPRLPRGVVHLRTAGCQVAVPGAADEAGLVGRLLLIPEHRVLILAVLLLRSRVVVRVLTR